jgi:hypothetical protein
MANVLPVPRELPEIVPPASQAYQLSVAVPEGDTLAAAERLSVMLPYITEVLVAGWVPKLMVHVASSMVIAKEPVTVPPSPSDAVK